MKRNAVKLTEQEMDEMDKELAELMAGKTKGYTFTQVKKMIKKKLRK